METLVPNYIDMEQARKSHVFISRNVLNNQDILDLFKVRDYVESQEVLTGELNNTQNVGREHKRCIFLNKGEDAIYKQAPSILAKLLRFALEARSRSDSWVSPLQNVGTGLSSCSIRVVEFWEYNVGGSLLNEWHYDGGSIFTIVVVLGDQFEGGRFRTHELPDGTHVEHALGTGDAVCFLSHKYHNVTPVSSGTRFSLVIELWEGKLPLKGR